jgi:hypothetical protein
VCPTVGHEELSSAEIPNDSFVEKPMEKDGSAVAVDHDVSVVSVGLPFGEGDTFVGVVDDGLHEFFFD